MSPGVQIGERHMINSKDLCQVVERKLQVDIKGNEGNGLSHGSSPMFFEWYLCCQSRALHRGAVLKRLEKEYCRNC